MINCLEIREILPAEDLELELKNVKFGVVLTAKLIHNYMQTFSKSFRGGYQAPECEVVNLACGGAVIMTSSTETGKSTIDDWGIDDIPLPF